MELFVSAGDTSSDIHCARILREIKKLTPVTSFGLGGDHLEKEGTSLFMHSNDFSVMGGPLEVISRLPRRGKLERLVEQRLLKKRPDGAILVDNGEINLRLASLLHFFGVPVVYYIPPKVWVWRMFRIEKIARHVDLVLSILPFEEEMYKEWEIPFKYVGNPLIDEIPEDLSEQKAKDELGLKSDDQVVTLMPGSRHSEIQYHAGLFSDSVDLFLKKLPKEEKKPVFLLPMAPSLDQEKVKRAFENKIPNLKLVCGKAHQCLKASRSALIKSGTSTLESAILGTPMTLTYQASRTSRWIYKHIVGYKGYIGMVNLFLVKPSESALGWGKRVEPVVPEVVLDRCTPENISDEMFKIYSKTPERDKMLGQISKARNMLNPPSELGASPSEAAGKAALDLFRSRSV